MNDQSHNDETLSWQIQQAIDRICDQFEAAWRDGPKPNLEAYLKESPSGCIKELFRELLELEFHWRRKQDETFSTKDYHIRFPEYSLLIDEVFSNVHKESGETFVNPSRESVSGIDWLGCSLLGK